MQVVMEIVRIRLLRGNRAPNVQLFPAATASHVFATSYVFAKTIIFCRTTMYMHGRIQLVGKGGSCPPPLLLAIVLLKSDLPPLKKKIYTYKHIFAPSQF